MKRGDRVLIQGKWASERGYSSIIGKTMVVTGVNSYSGDINVATHLDKRNGYWSVHPLDCVHMKKVKNKRFVSMLGKEY